MSFGQLMMMVMVMCLVEVEDGSDRLSLVSSLVLVERELLL